MRILIVKISSMGDIIHTLPALSDAVRIIKNISFNWVVEENFIQIPTWHSAVSQVIPVAIRRWRKNWFNTIIRQERSYFKYQLQRERYDLVIDAQGLMKSAVLITSMAYGEKHGFNYKSAREPLVSWFYQRRHNISKQQHAIERIRQLFAASLGYKITNTIGDYAITHYFSPKQSTENYLIFIHATTSVDKHWPEAYWHTLSQLVSNAGYRVRLPWYIESERLRAERIVKGISLAIVLPLLTLTQVATQLMRATAIVSVDTGLSHLAAALNCPNLTLYGPTKPWLIGNYGRNQFSLYAKNAHMKNITVNYVWRIVKFFLLSPKS